MDKLNTVNRCYMWRILFDHVRMGHLKIDDFWRVFIRFFKDEKNEDLTIYLLNKIKWLVEVGFIDSELMHPPKEGEPLASGRRESKLNLLQ